MSQKTSTAALDSFGEGRLPNRRRAPRHPASGRRENKEATKQGSNEKAKEEAKEFGQARILVCQGGDINKPKANRPAGKLRLILPVILRITFSLVLWTLGAAPMTWTEAQTGKDRLIREMPLMEARHEFH